ncbi:MAG TPA: hypothetical protein VFW47_11725 [Phenylobacterium sp.]|nr:hypothetical protein [Phenylobacterium sp.]
MSRNAAMAGFGKGQKSVSSIACLAFVAVLATAFWAGAVWIGNLILQLVAAA